MLNWWTVLDNYWAPLKRLHYKGLLLHQLVCHSYYCSEAQLVCELCSVLASGLMRPWVPRPNVNASSTSASPTKGKKRVSSTRKNKTSGNALQLEVDPTGIPNLREALEVIPVCFKYPSNITMCGRCVSTLWVFIKGCHCQWGSPSSTHGLKPSNYWRRRLPRTWVMIMR